MSNRPPRETNEVLARGAGAERKSLLGQRWNHGPEWETIVPIASEAGCSAETLRRCVRRYQTDHGDRAGVPAEDKARRCELAREVYVLRRSNEFLRRAGASVAQVEVDCPAKR